MTVFARRCLQARLPQEMQQCWAGELRACTLDSARLVLQVVRRGEPVVTCLVWHFLQLPCSAAFF